MSQTDITEAVAGKARKDSPGVPGDGDALEARPQRGAARAGAGPFKHYKPEQGKTTRTSTFIGVGLVIAWGAYFVWERLQVYQGDEAWRLLVTTGIPILFVVAVGAVAWWFLFSHRATSDFLIATEGEMKKVSWSSRREIIGSTKVVILFTVMLAVFLFLVDLFFQFVFSGLGVLKT